MCALLTQADCLADKVEVVLVLEPCVDSREVLGAALPDAAVDDADLHVVGLLPVVGDKVHEGAARVALARSSSAQLKMVQDKVPIKSDVHFFTCDPAHMMGDENMSGRLSSFTRLRL